MIRTVTLSAILAVSAIAATAGTADARSAYDGSWSLSIVTQRGTCSTYNLPVEITNGHVSFPGLVRANGRVAPNGSVRVTVAAGDKPAWGAGKLSLGSGRGHWSGRSGNDRCSGTWTAQRG
jgi:hypothetical protein